MEKPPAVARPNWQKWLCAIGALLAFFLLCYVYLYPGIDAVITGDTHQTMSDGTDPAGAPYEYVELLKSWHEHPSRFFYGAIYVDGYDPDHGAADWKSWSERWLLVLDSYFIPVEQLAPSILLWLLLFDALAMYALCRTLKWNYSVSSGLALAWTFCAFIRARAKVHLTMTSTYHLPLIFLGLLLVTRYRSRRSLAAATACFLFATTVVHYFVVTSLFLSPFFLVFVFIEPEFRADKKRVLIRLATALLPALVFLALNFAFPVPSNTRLAPGGEMPQSGATFTGNLHPYLWKFAASPIDYISNDIALEYKPTDLNPLRELVNRYVFETATGGNPHERTNGIRWSILALGFLALLAAFRGKVAKGERDRRAIFFFSAFALFTFWLSLAPDVPWPGFGPSGWLNRVVPQVRVPSRAGLNTHFAFLMLAGLFLHSKAWSDKRIKKWLLLPGVFPLLMILDYPPLIQKMPMARVLEPYKNLAPNGPCGAGFYFPFFSQWTDVPFYEVLELVRGTNCQILNGTQSQEKIKFMTDLFPPDQHFLQQLDQNPRVANDLERIVRCAPLSWIAFNPIIDAKWANAICERLQWKMNSDMTCVSQAPHQPYRQFPDKCF